MNKNSNNLKLSSLLYFFSLSLLAFIFFLVSFSSVFFLLGISINLISLILSTIFTSITIYYFASKHGLSSKNILKIQIAALFTLIFGIFINSFIYDFSWDGNSYHKTAIGMLADGWNPVRQSAKDFSLSSKNSIKETPTINRNFTYENHYPKAHWIFAANIYKLTQKIESGHSLGLISLVAIFSLSLSFLIRKIKLSWSIIISFLATLSPVLSAQIFTYYNDGLQGLYIVGLIFALIMIVEQKSKIEQFCKYFLFLILGSLLINFKFTGLMFAGLYSLSFFIFTLVQSKLRKKESMKFFLSGILLLIWSILVIGSSSYLKNTFSNGHPFYPLAGANKIDIMKTSSPKEFLEDNRPLVPFLKSLFAKTANIMYKHDEKVSLKIPFTVSPQEFRSLAVVDTRISGQGIFFSGIFLLSLSVIIWIFAKAKHNALSVYLCILIPTILVILFVKETWWARYIPQLSAISTLALYLLVYFQKSKKLTLIIAVFALLNTLASFGVYSARIGYHSLRSDFCKTTILKNRTDINLHLRDLDFYGALYNIKDCAGVKNIRVMHDSSAQQINLIDHIVKIKQ